MDKTEPMVPGDPGTVPLCATCNGAEVMRDAWAVWDTTTGQWVLGPVFDAGFCDTCGVETSFFWISQAEHQRQQIRALNDALRRGDAGPHDRILATSGIQSLGLEAIAAILRAVAQFNDFGVENDPHHEHDFGAFEHAGHRIYFKIDYYDPDLEAASADPTDPEQTARVLTIMLASEY